MGRMTAHFRFVTNPSVSRVTEQNDLLKPPVTRYWLQFGDLDLYLDRADAELLHRDLDCLLGDPSAHAEARCIHSRQN